MALIIVILALLILAAMIYGVFFLIFKLGWVVAGKNTNKWPLILAGISTVLLFAVSILSLMVGLNKYVSPIMDVVNTTLQKTEITTGVRPYTDPKYGFTINLFGGTEMTKWIEIDKESSLIFGFDTNIGAVSKKNRTMQNDANMIPPISGLLVFVQQEEPLANVQEYLMQQVNALQETQNYQFQLKGEPDYSVPNTVFLEGEGISPQGKNFKVHMAFAAQDDLRYMLIGFVTGNSTYQQMVKEEINSFRVDGLPPAPLPRNTPFAVPNTEVPAALPQTAN